MAPAPRRVMRLLLLLLPPAARSLMRPETEALLQLSGQGRQTQEPVAQPCTSYGPGLHLVQLPLLQRQFLLSVPEDFAPGSVPLVFVFHGFSDSPWYSNRMLGFSKKMTRDLLPKAF